MSKYTVLAYTHTGESAEKVSLPESVFACPVNQQLLRQAIRVYLSNQRQGTKQVQTRSDVQATTAKVWRQKGTGRARHGSRRAPVFVGGGQAHGPSGIENYRLSLSKRMRKQAICSALSSRFNSEDISVLVSADSFDISTKAVIQFLEKSVAYAEQKHILIITDQPHENLLKSIRNLAGVTMTQASRLNVYEVLKADKILIAQDAVESLVNLYTVSKSEE